MADRPTTSRPNTLEAEQSNGVKPKFPIADKLKSLAEKSKHVSVQENALNGRNESPASILDALLEQLKVVNFKEKVQSIASGLSDSEQALKQIKIPEKVYRIATISELMKIAHRNDWNLSRINAFLYLYNGQQWLTLPKELFQTFLVKASLKMGVPKIIAKDYEYRDKLYKQFLADALLEAPPQELNRGSVLINLKNCTLQVNNQGIRKKDFSAQDGLMYQLPFEYNPSATAPRFQSFLTRCIPDEEKQQVLAEFLALCFIPGKAIKVEKAVILLGSGANGKSVFAEIVAALFGSENISHYSLQSLTAENGYYLAMSQNMLLNYAAELSTKLENPAKFKQITSLEPVEARLPYQEPFILTKYPRLMFNCNVLPKDVEHTPAFFRRFLIIRFNVTIPEAEQDKTLHSYIIENELPGVLNWVLDGLTWLLKQGNLSHCQDAEDAVAQYKKESDSVQLFIEEEGFHKSKKATMPLKDGLYYPYRSFCMEGGFKYVNLKTFSDRLKNLGFETTRRNTGMVVYAEQSEIHS